jgi:hypothetical protein
MDDHTIFQMIQNSLAEIQKDVRSGRDEILDLNKRVGHIEGKAAIISMVVAAVSSGIASFIIGLFKHVGE